MSKKLRHLMFLKQVSLKNMNSRFLSAQRCRRQLIADFCFGVRKLSSVTVSDIYNSQEIGREIEIKGWVKSLRNMKKTVFVDVNDGSTFHFLQVVISKKILPKELSYGSSIVVSGKLNLAPSGQTELTAETIQVLGTCRVEEGYPFIEGKKYLPEEQRFSLHFRPRTRSCSSVFRLRSQITNIIHNWFQSENFVLVHTPILTSNSCEGGGETFKAVPKSQETIDSMMEVNNNEDEAFFSKTVYLTESGQLHLEVTARSLCNVYQFGPVFRAENNRSRFHLAEFYMIEAEMAFLNSIDELNNFIEKFIKTVITKILDTQEEEIGYYRKIYDFPEFNAGNILNKPYSVMDYGEACELLKRNSHKLKQPYHETKHLTKDHELFLLEHNGQIPIFVINWPENKKPFYVKTSNMPSQVAAVDLLFPGVGELCGGSLREDNYEILEERLKKLELLDTLMWYLELRKFGNVPTGGFGMGYERFLKALLGTRSVKDTIPFPRSPHNCQL